jgi:hypothetical protein
MASDFDGVMLNVLGEGSLYFYFGVSQALPN